MQLLGELLENCIAIDELHAPFLRRSVAEMTPAWRAKVEDYLTLRKSQGMEPAVLASRYAKFVETIRLETIFFMRNKHYRYSTFLETNEHVYQNPEFMEPYMEGLALSLFLWPTHRKLFDFFTDTLPRDNQGDYLEIGPGHGYFLSEALAISAYRNFVAADVSPHAIEKAREAVAFMAKDKIRNVAFKVGDIFEEGIVEGKYDAIVMGEVMEHVEDPLGLLKRLKSFAKPDGYIYVTTCTCAPVVDHIYLFRTVQEVRDMIAEAGLRIVDEVTVGQEGKSVEFCEKKSLTVNMAFSLSPA